MATSGKLEMKCESEIEHLEATDSGSAGGSDGEVMEGYVEQRGKYDWPISIQRRIECRTREIRNKMNWKCKKEEREETVETSQTDSEGIADSPVPELDEPRTEEGLSTSNKEATDTNSGNSSQDNTPMEMDEREASNFFHCQSYGTPIRNSAPPPCSIYNQPSCIPCRIEKIVRERSVEEEWPVLRLGWYEYSKLDPLNFCSPVPHEFEAGIIVVENYQVRHISSQTFERISGVFAEGKENSLSARQRKLFNHISGKEVDNGKIKHFNLIQQGRTIQYIWKIDTKEEAAETSIIDDRKETRDSHEQITEHDSNVKSHCQVFGTPITTSYPPGCLVYANMSSPLCIPCHIEFLARQCRPDDVDYEEELRCYAHHRLFNSFETFKDQKPVEFDDDQRVGNWDICKIPTSRFFWIKQQIQSGHKPQLSKEELRLYWILTEQFDRNTHLTVCNTIELGKTIQFLVRKKSSIQEAAAVPISQDDVSDQQQDSQAPCSSSPPSVAQRNAGSPVQASPVVGATAQLQSNRRIPRVRAAIAPSDRVLRPRAATNQAIPAVPPQHRQPAGPACNGQLTKAQARKPRQPRQPQRAAPRQPPRRNVQPVRQRNVRIQYRSGQILTEAEVIQFLDQNTCEIRVNWMSQAEAQAVLGRNQGRTRAPRQPRIQAPRAPARGQRAAQPQALRRSERIRNQRLNF